MNHSFQHEIAAYEQPKTNLHVPDPEQFRMPQNKSISISTAYMRAGDLYFSGRVPIQEWKPSINCTHVPLQEISLQEKIFEKYYCVQREIKKVDHYLTTQKFPVKFYTDAQRQACKIVCRLEYFTNNNRITTKRGDEFHFLGTGAIGNPELWVKDFLNYIKTEKKKLIRARIFDNFRYRVFTPHKPGDQLIYVADTTIYDYHFKQIQTDFTNEYLTF